MNNVESNLRALERESQEYLDGILQVVKQKSKFLDGNLFYVNMAEAEAKSPSEELRVKRENFLFLTSAANNILEIGFNAGHSALIALLANKKSKVTIVDTCEHIYTEATFEFLSNQFPGRLKLIKGDSINVLPKLNDTFDLIHFDGGKDKTIRQDLENCVNIVDEKHVLIIDDTQNEKLLAIVNNEIQSGMIEKDKFLELSRKSEQFKWKHLIATYMNSKNTEDNEELRGFSGGAWDERTHLKLHAKNFNKGMADFIVNEIKPKSFIEFGSGLGFLAKHLDSHLDLGCSYCIEPKNINGLYGEMSQVEFLQLDIFNDQMPEKLDKKFDLVMSIEVAEHIARDKHDELFNFLVNRSNNWVIFSGARIGQGGHGHIAERAEEDWKQEFLSRGMTLETELTQSIRHACDQKNINHRKNLMVFSKNTKKVTIFSKLKRFFLSGKE